jgi:hypothetical protein
MNIDIILLFFIFLLFYYLFLIQIPKKNQEKQEYQEQLEMQKINDSVNEFLSEKERMKLAKEIINDDDNTDIINNIKNGIDVQNNINILLERTFYQSIISSKPYKDFHSNL